MFQDISLDELLEKQKDTTHTIIDVRSPKEFQEATIPGSVNIPLFTDDERAQVGTIYKQVGHDEAKEKGLEIFSKKLPDFVQTFKKIEGSKTVFCWRGGMRSETVATVLALMGIHVTRLSEGIRAYRNWVVETLANESFTPELFVINGYTGTGKTIILKRLEKLGFPVIDLEGMAGHRGSIFGQIGTEPSKQKKFDSLLVTAMEKFQKESFVLVEGESKRIGKVVLPEFFFKKKGEGLQIFIDLPMEERVKIILDDYKPWEDPEQFIEAFQFIKRRIHIPIAKQIETSLEEQDFANAVKLLLEYYYDPRYQHANDQYGEDQKVVIKAANLDIALQQLLDYIHENNIQQVN